MEDATNKFAVSVKSQQRRVFLVGFIVAAVPILCHA
jgi:hypothetical protein